MNVVCSSTKPTSLPRKNKTNKRHTGPWLKGVFSKDHKLTWDYWNNELKLSTNLLMISLILFTNEYFSGVTSDRNSPPSEWVLNSTKLRSATRMVCSIIFVGRNFRLSGRLCSETSTWSCNLRSFSQRNLEKTQVCNSIWQDAISEKGTKGQSDDAKLDSSI